MFSPYFCLLSGHQRRTAEGDQRVEPEDQRGERADRSSPRVAEEDGGEPGRAWSRDERVREPAFSSAGRPCL